MLQRGLIYLYLPHLTLCAQLAEQPKIQQNSLSKIFMSQKSKKKMINKFVKIINSEDIPFR
jgi:hypothetical protein